MVWTLYVLSTCVAHVTSQGKIPLDNALQNASQQGVVEHAVAMGIHFHRHVIQTMPQETELVRYTVPFIQRKSRDFGAATLLGGNLMEHQDPADETLLFVLVHGQDIRPQVHAFDG